MVKVNKSQLAINGVVWLNVGLNQMRSHRTKCGSTRSFQLEYQLNSGSFDSSSRLNLPATLSTEWKS